MKTSRSAAYPVVEGVPESRQPSDDDTATCSTMQTNKSDGGTIKPMYVYIVTCFFAKDYYMFVRLIYVKI